MKKIIFTFVLVISSTIIFGQTYNMKIKQGTGTTYSATSTVDEITFVNTTATPFACGDVILYGGETYHTTLIGSQCWFQENLNIGTKIDGSLNQTNNSLIEKYCYNNNPANCTTYGGLYQWAEVVQYQNGASNTTSPSPAFTGNVQGICPTGWHIPTQAELQTLNTTVGGNGITLKALGHGTNESGFSALLPGYRDSYDGSFAYVSNDNLLWCTSENGGLNGYLIYLNHINSEIRIYADGKEYGFSVRCLKDN